MHRTSFVVLVNCNEKYFVQNLPNFKIEGANLTEACNWKLKEVQFSITCTGIIFEFE